MKDEVIFIVGKRGSGKSTLAKRVLSRFERIVIFDPLSEYREGAIVKDMDTLFAFMVNPPEKFILICRFQSDDMELIRLQYEYAAKLCKLIGNLILVLEEAEMFIDSYDSSSYINFLISYGRHYHVSLLAIGRRPREIPIRFRSNFSSIAVFKTSEPSDLAHLKAYGFDTEEIANLPEYEYALLGEEIES